MSDDSTPLRFVTPRGRLIALAVVCLLVTVLGVLIVVLNPDQIIPLLLGVAVIGIFGLGGGISIVRQLIGSTVLRADADGVRLAGLGVVPWTDIDRIGTTPQGELGLRFRRPDALVTNPRSSIDPADMRATRSVSGGYDLTFSERELGTPPGDAARALRARRP
ncbi:S-adenosylmethionine:tRNA ribosyltransferase-isomerase [Microbacterium caowuchunii]|uniref:S-adenosylmethionine:tRNA ribosyltransferase-isomerase n=1 Tax=Microbacterium caowuchunii TaxID=2614638 RepID=A0A5N0TL42_9MICO|nr:S-adenosylmethionine:tRNA ribosyltransferase-isomerase [Microbacterium caowuchunii]KAA9135875.1 S-adenosylmethionine:tRNA ribosyltransferase-isomerase [Microbacterium caowuchunii]